MFSSKKPSHSKKVTILISILNLAQTLLQALIYQVLPSGRFPNFHERLASPSRAPNSRMCVNSPQKTVISKLLIYRFYL